MYPPYSMWQRLLLTLYALILSGWFRVGKVTLSKLANLTRPGLPPTLHSGTDLHEFAQWWQQHTEWHADPFNGAFDIFPSLSHAEWQWAHEGKFRDDCDGLAYLAANQIKPFADAANEVFVVTVVTDPFSWGQYGLLMAAHVICLFRRGGRWQMISNSQVFADAWLDFDEALQENPYAYGHPVLFYEVRDANLRFVRSKRLPTPKVKSAVREILPPGAGHF